MDLGLKQKLLALGTKKLLIGAGAAVALLGAVGVAAETGTPAVNVQCRGCLTVARAIQYNISVDDPTTVPSSVNQLIARMKAELARIKTSSPSLADAESGFDGVIAQFRDLAAYLKDSRD